MKKSIKARFLSHIALLNSKRISQKNVIYEKKKTSYISSIEIFSKECFFILECMSQAAVFFLGFFLLISQIYNLALTYIHSNTAFFRLARFALKVITEKEDLGFGDWGIYFKFIGLETVIVCIAPHSGLKAWVFHFPV